MHNAPTLRPSELGRPTLARAPRLRVLGPTLRPILTRAPRLRVLGAIMAVDLTTQSASFKKAVPLKDKGQPQLTQGICNEAVLSMACRLQAYLEDNLRCEDSSRDGDLPLPFLPSSQAARKACTPCPGPTSCPKGASLQRAASLFPGKPNNSIRANVGAPSLLDSQPTHWWKSSHVGAEVCAQGGSY